ncbi:hypothetical protein JG688_00010450, partial [Phytophthora aleatoria]
EAIKQAAACGKHEIFHILENNYSAIAVTAALSRLSRGGDNVREMPESQPEHQTLRFFVPGFGPFEIDLSSVDTVSELKRLLHAERPDCFGDVPALSIWLYLAKRGDEWLCDDSEDTKLLAIGDSSRVRDLLVWQVMSTRHVKDVFKGVPHGSTIHAIALKPMLRCIPGSRPFGINLDTIMQIEDFKKMIKAEMACDFTKVDTSDIQLYLTKKNEEWLSLSSGGTKALMVGELSSTLAISWRDNSRR